MGHFLRIKKEVTQGDPLAMIIYGLGIRPLIQDLRTDHPIVNQPWYDNDSRVIGTFSGIRRHLNGLMVRGTRWVFFLEPTKSILVIFPRNVP